MRKNLIKLVTYLQAFVLGGYVTSQYKFNTPIEPYRWALTTFFFLFFLAQSIKEEKN